MHGYHMRTCFMDEAGHVESFDAREYACSGLKGAHFWGVYCRDNAGYLVWLADFCEEQDAQLFLTLKKEGSHE